MPDLLKLAERCEQATEPDSQLDAEIDLAVRADAHTSTAPGYTRSLDWAMALVPEEWTAWELRSRRAKTRFVAELSRESDKSDSSSEEFRLGRGRSAPLAICAAALRAIAKARSEP